MLGNSLKVIQVHNKSRYTSGGNIIVDDTIALLKRRGTRVACLTRSSKGLDANLTSKFQAFMSSIYSPFAYKSMAQLIQLEHPDIVHVHNLYPMLSPSVLVACHRASVPVVMTCHDFRLICPTWFNLSHNRVCDRCAGGSEYWCILKNCRGNIFESIAYTLSSTVARKWKLFQNNVTVFTAPSNFAKMWLINVDFIQQQILVLPNMVTFPGVSVNPAMGEYIAYAGRFSFEKGIDTLLAAAKLLPQLSIRLAGDYSTMPEVLKAASANVEFVGLLDRSQLSRFFRKARFLVVPSKGLETFGMVAAEAMSYGLPIIASRIGGLAEIVEDGVTGLLFEPGNPEELAEKMKLLWKNPELCQKMGRAGQQKAIREYSEDVYYKRLMTIYEMTIEINNANQKIQDIQSNT